MKAFLSQAPYTVKGHCLLRESACGKPSQPSAGLPPSSHYCSLSSEIHYRGFRDDFPHYLSSIMMDDKALVPAVEMFMSPNLHLEFLEQCLVSPFSHGVHCGTHVIQNAHNPWGILMCWGTTTAAQVRGKNYDATCFPQTENCICYKNTRGPVRKDFPPIV